MNEALGNKAAAWADCVVGFVAGTLAFRPDLQALARGLAAAAWREGCPRARDFLDSTSQNCRRMRLRTQSSLAYSVLLIAWPAGYASALHDHDGLWGIDVVLDGILELEAFSLPQPDAPVYSPKESRILGAGDHLSFPGLGYAHRCRNLSERQPALSLHIYGGQLTRYRTFHEDAPGHWRSAVSHAPMERALL